MGEAGWQTWSNLYSPEQGLLNIESAYRSGSELTISRPEETGAFSTIDGPKPGLLGTLRRFGWGLGDQLLSSVTNFLLVALVARAVSPADFGAFSLAYATFTLSLGAVRALAGEPLVVRYSSVSELRWREGVKLASGMAFAAGALVGLGSLIAGGVVGGSLGVILGDPRRRASTLARAGHVSLRVLRSWTRRRCSSQRCHMGRHDARWLLARDSHEPSDRGVVHTFVGDRRIPRIPRRARTAEVVAEQSHWVNRMGQAPT